jgi:hypothetical protein
VPPKIIDGEDKYYYNAGIIADESLLLPENLKLARLFSFLFNY